MTWPESGNPGSRYRDTLRQVFRHPGQPQHRLAVMSLLQAVGTVSVRHDGKVAVKIGPELEFLEPAAAWLMLGNGP